MPQAQNKPKKDSFFNIHLTSTISITFVLYIVGLFSFLLLYANNFSKSARENIAISVVMKDSVSSEDSMRLSSYLTKVKAIKKFNYISKEDALIEYTGSMGANPEELLGYNPLHNNYEIFLYSAHTSKEEVDQFITKLRSFHGIADISYQDMVMKLLDTNIKRILFLSALIALILIFISSVLINNTVRLNIYSRRFIINTMQLVGAKPSFIARPFLRRALWNGILASVFALIFLAITTYYMMIQMGIPSISIYNTQIFIPIIAIVLLLSILINEIATYFAVYHFIRLHTNKLYYI